MSTNVQTDPRDAALLKVAADYYAAVAEVEEAASRRVALAAEHEAAGRIGRAGDDIMLALGLRMALAFFRTRLGGLPRE